jgi:hypothetical protein
MAPFEALYERKCQTPLVWSEVGERSLFGPNMIKEAEEQVAKVQENLKVAQARTPTQRFCLLKGITHQGYSKISSQRKISPTIYWTILDHREDWNSGLLHGVTSRDVRHTRCISHVTTKEMPEGTARTSTYGSHGLTTRLTVSRKTN